MTQEDKQLLLKDLCARLPYDVQCEIGGLRYGPYTFTGEDVEDLIAGRTFKPYLRPLSSMTEEEKKELRQEHVKDEKLYAECLIRTSNGDNSMRGKIITHFAADWCNKNHFDYRGLIPMGLALKAKEGMYKAEAL